MLGDQVYADETAEATRRRIRAGRDITALAGDQVADFEELLEWSGPSTAAARLTEVSRLVLSSR
jgi:hypothetical protein